MRLTCPNCGAQYEVPDAVIPTSGRDVQCSNCGNTWFQHHRDHMPPEDPPSEPVEAAAPRPAAETTPDPAPRPAATQRRIDPEVADILREEAERERAARAAEVGARLETQPDLGLDESGPARDERDRQARARLDRLRGGIAGDDEAPAAAPRGRTRPDRADADMDPPSRRNLFPDIDEINSSLSASEDNGATISPPMLPEEAGPPPRASGFRTGFRLAVITCVLALIVYVMAPRIAVLLPGSEGALAQYVAAVDALRAQLSQAVAGLLTGG